MDGMRITEFGTDMAQVDSTDVHHVLAAGRLRRLQRIDEPANRGILDRVDPALEMVVKRADQNRHDRERMFLAQHVLQPDHLKLDRVLGSVHELVFEELLARRRGDPVHILPIRRCNAQRGLKVFQRQCEVTPAILVRDAQNDEGVSLGILGQLFVSPSVNGSAPTKIDMRADHSP